VNFDRRFDETLGADQARCRRLGSVAGRPETPALRANCSRPLTSDPVARRCVTKSTRHTCRVEPLVTCSKQKIGAQSTRHTHQKGDPR
jgi:hypothetical protein